MENLPGKAVQMAWDRRNEQQDVRSQKLQAALANLAEVERKYRPATLEEAIQLLTPCLMLCAPSGMTEDDRTAWIKAALMTIDDIPLSFLQRACEQARRVCDHPAKIVPFICKYEPDTARWAADKVRHARAVVENLNAPRLEKHDPEYVTAEEMAELSKELASKLSAQ